MLTKNNFKLCCKQWKEALSEKEKEKSKNKGKNDRRPSTKSKNKGNKSDRSLSFPPFITAALPFPFVWRHSPLLCKVNSGECLHYSWPNWEPKCIKLVQLSKIKKLVCYLMSSLFMAAYILPNIVFLLEKKTSV